MNNITSHTGKLEIIERLPSSYSGNPRFLLRVDGHTCRTSPDSSIAYAIQNHDGKVVSATIGAHYGKATLNTIKGE